MQPPDRLPSETSGGGRAALRPLNLLVLLAGAGLFVTTLQWWAIPLTLLVYVTLVALTSRDQTLRQRVLEESSRAQTPSEPVAPERRARWLPRGATREKVEAALDVSRKVAASIEGSDDVTRAVLGDAVPKLKDANERLVDVAENREKAASAIADLRAAGREGSPELLELGDEISDADAEISATLELLLSLRARVVRLSIDSGPAARANADDLYSALDDMNLRLEALSETMSPPTDDRDV